MDGKQLTNDIKEEQLRHDRDEMLNNACCNETRDEQDDLNDISSNKRYEIFTNRRIDNKRFVGFMPISNK